MMVDGHWIFRTFDDMIRLRKTQNRGTPKSKPHGVLTVGLCAAPDFVWGLLAETTGSNFHHALAVNHNSQRGHL